MTRRSRSLRKDYEQRYPYKVELPEKPGGYGQRLNEMHEWCRDNAEDWRAFGGRFYFMREADAEGFRRVNQAPPNLYADL